MRLIVLTGKRFGLVTVSGRAEPKSPPKWHCVCDCGGHAVILGDHLRSNHSTTCGCRGISLRPEFSQAFLHEVLDYNRETGEFRWKKTLWGQKVGDLAGSFEADYVVISIYGKIYAAHRLAWFYIHGTWPESDIDHRNLNKQDNSLNNLREATRSQNFANTRIRRDNTSGYKGVSFHKNNGKWRAYLGINKKISHLGYFERPDDAARAYDVAAKEEYGDFARLNFQEIV